MTPEERRGEAKLFLEQIMLRYELQDVEDAIDWVVITHDKETGRVLTHGGFGPGGMLNAHDWADAHLADIHSDFPDGEKGWDVTVHPLIPARPDLPRKAG